MCAHRRTAVHRTGKIHSEQNRFIAIAFRSFMNFKGTKNKFFLYFTPVAFIVFLIYIIFFYNFASSKSEDN